MLKYQKALLLAEEKHRGQVDKAGEDYLIHLLTVKSILNSDDEDLNIIAILHDIIEDTDINFAVLHVHFGDRVADAVKLLTKVKGQSSKEYYKGIKSNQDALRVKIADLMHNSDLNRISKVTEKDIRRTKNYLDKLEELRGELK